MLNDKETERDDVLDQDAADEEIAAVEESVAEEDEYIPEAVAEDDFGAVETADVPEVIETPAEVSFVDLPQEGYTDKFADAAVVNESTVPPETAAEPKVKKLVKVGKGDNKYGKTLTFVSYFALLLGAAIIAVNALLGLFKVEVGSTLTGISQLMTYTVVAIVGVRFINNKPKGWLIAYIVAVVLIVVFIALPIIMDIIEKLPEKETAEQIVKLLF